VDFEKLQPHWVVRGRILRDMLLEMAQIRLNVGAFVFSLDLTLQARALVPPVLWSDRGLFVKAAVPNQDASLFVVVLHPDRVSE
jgi:predicted secreted hydrolase